MGITKELKITIAKKRKFSEISLLVLNKTTQSPSIPLHAPNSLFPKHGSGKKWEFFHLEAEKLPQISHLIINPDTIFKCCWDILSVLIILFQAIMIPFLETFPYPKHTLWMHLLGACNLYFAVDILLSFNTSYHAHGHLEKSRKKIFTHYIKSWFFVDFFATFPYIAFTYANTSIGLDYYSHSDYDFLPKFILLLKFTPLIRMIKVKRLIDGFQNILWSSFVILAITIFKLILIAFFVAHWCACIWFYVSFNGARLNPDTWITFVYHEGVKRIIELYHHALYFSLTTMATVGYGDIKPHTVAEKEFCIYMLFIAVIVFSYVLSSISDKLIKKNEEERALKNKLTNINVHMKNNRIPPLLKFRVRRYVEYIFKNEKIENGILSNAISKSLRTEIFQVVKGKLINKCKIFSQLYNNRFIGNLGEFIHERVFGPDDVVIREGELSYNLYFISSGVIELYHNETKKVFKALGQGSYFGEIGFFAKQMRSCSVRCLSFAELFVFARDDLDKALSRFPFERSITFKFMERCQKDYSVLGIYCYLCKKFGHVALRCKNCILELDHNYVKSKWLKTHWGTKLISKESVDINPNFERKVLKVNWQDAFNSKNVVGIYRCPEHLYTNNEILQKKSNAFINSSRKLRYKICEVKEERPSSIGKDTPSQFSRTFDGYSDASKGYNSVIDSSSSEELSFKNSSFYSQNEIEFLSPKSFTIRNV